jgi:hypothetical protein
MLTESYIAQFPQIYNIYYKIAIHANKFLYGLKTSLWVAIERYKKRYTQTYIFTDSFIS